MIANPTEQMRLPAAGSFRLAGIAACPPQESFVQLVFRRRYLSPVRICRMPSLPSNDRTPKKPPKATHQGSDTQRDGSGPEKALTFTRKALTIFPKALTISQKSVPFPGGA